MSADACVNLGIQQAALLDALLSSAPAPIGFNALRIQAAARSLAEKRRHAVMTTWPILAGVLDERFAGLFDGYGTSNALPAEGNANLDGRLFCDWLANRGEFPQEATIERMRYDLHYLVSDSRLLTRRGPRVLIERCGKERKWVVGLVLSGLGEYWWHGG